MKPNPNPGWHNDPLGIHKKRWWSGTQWTDKTTDIVPNSKQASFSAKETKTAEPRKESNDKVFVTTDTKSLSNTTSTTLYFSEDTKKSSNERISQDASRHSQIEDPNTIGGINHESEISNENPVINNWKTSMGFSILGWVSRMLFWWLGLSMLYLFLVELIAVPIAHNLGIYLDEEMVVNFFALTGIALLITCRIIYPGLIYTSYFKNRPLVKSSKVISFLNLFCGGFIFGSLWNCNLTTSRIENAPHTGVSYIVYIIISIIRLIIAFWTAL